MRLGQQHTVKVYEYVVDDSFNMQQMTKNMQKMVLELMAQLNSHLFSDIDSSSALVDLGCWVCNGDGSISQVSNEVASTIGEKNVLSGNFFLEALFSALKDGSVIQEGNSDWG